VTAAQDCYNRAPKGPVRAAEAEMREAAQFTLERDPVYAADLGDLPAD
jgi:hypothetical protein